MFESLSLDGSWVLKGPQRTEIPAQVPGCVHADLRREGLIPDPYFRDNETQVQWVGEADWTYSRSFQAGSSLLQRDRVILRCHGLDTFATIRLNDRELAQTDNMFRQWEFDIRELLREGENTIEIRLASTLPYARKRQEEHFLWLTGIGHHRISGGNWVRKEQSNYGWDWGPMIVTAGIWRSIDIHGFDTARLEDMQVQQFHAKGSRKVELAVSLSCETTRREKLAALVTVEKDGEELDSRIVPVVRKKATARLELKKPQLWWPNGLGEQPLYTVTATLLAFSGETVDTQSRRVGIRQLKLVREKDQWGESFCFEANGRRFFAKGANWIPSDQFDAWASDSRNRQLLQSAKEANMNMIRVWGGGKYERDDFYDACDELGLCVWQDFMFACSAYPAFDPAFIENVKAEVAQQTRRLRHHPSLALWCGNNEIEHIKPILGDGPGQMPWSEYKMLFDEVIATIVAREDPQTDYWPSSEHSPVGDRSFSANPDCGDAHLWKVWHGREPFEWYRGAYHRFCSEFGFQSFPEPSTVESFTLPEDRNVTSYIMEAHQRSPIGNSAIIDYMLSWFRLPVGYESTVWLSQILQGLAIKYAVEHWRMNKPRCMGALYWQLNDCWPVASWSSIDYYGKWKALHFAARKFFNPLLVTGVEDRAEGKVDIHVVSDLLESKSLELSWRVVDMAGNSLDSGSKRLRIAAESNRLVKTLSLRKIIEAVGERGLMVVLQLRNGRTIESENFVTFARPKHLELQDPKLSVKVKPFKSGFFDVTITARKPALWVWLELEGMSARYSDNFTHLIEGGPTTIRVTPKEKLSLADFKKRLRARSLIDTYQG